MWDSFFPFLSDVADYWWAIVMGLLAPLVFDLPQMIGSESFQAKLAGKFPSIRRHLRWGAFAGLLVAAFLAYHDERSERLRLENGQGLACNAAIEQVSQIKGGYVVSRLFRITGTPYGVTFFARGEDIDYFRVENPDPRRMMTTAETKIDGGLGVFIGRPQGLYEVVLKAGNPDSVVISHEMECAPNVSR